MISKTRKSIQIEVHLCAKIRVFVKKFVHLITKDEEEVIEKTRLVLDFENLLKEKEQKVLSTDIFAAATFPRFQKVVEDLKVPSLEFVPDSVIENQYRNFITKLTKLIPDQVEKNKIDPGVVEKNQIDTRQIISKLISEKAHPQLRGCCLLLGKRRNSSFHYSKTQT